LGLSKIPNGITDKIDYKVLFYSLIQPYTTLFSVFYSGISSGIL